MPTPPPNEDAFRALTADPERGPIVMLNLLKFEGALAPDGPFASPSGRDSYMRYAGEARKHVEKRGGRILWQGRVRATMIGAEQWDVVALVEYPNGRAFLDMLQDRDYQEAGKHHAAGLADTRLICCEVVDAGTMGY